jgi:hypothetical protein
LVFGLICPDSIRNPFACSYPFNTFLQLFPLFNNKTNFFDDSTAGAKRQPEPFSIKRAAYLCTYKLSERSEKKEEKKEKRRRIRLQGLS